MVSSVVDKWMDEQHDLALEQDKEVEEERERIRLRGIAVRANEDRRRSESAMRYAAEAARRQEEMVNARRKFRRKQKHREKTEYMISLMA